MKEYEKQPGRLSVFYDGDCGLCRRAIQTVHRLDLFRRIDSYDICRQWEEIQRRFPRLDHAACFADMHAVTSRGKVVTGFFAYREIAKRAPLGWLVLPLLYLPGVPLVGQAVYQRVARGRERGSCPGHPRE